MPASCAGLRSGSHATCNASTHLALLAVAGQRVGGHGNDDGPFVGRKAPAQLARRVETVHACARRQVASRRWGCTRTRHLDIHEDDVVSLLLAGLQGGETIAGGIELGVAQPLENGKTDFDVNRLRAGKRRACKAILDDDARYRQRKASGGGRPRPPSYTR